MQPELLLEIVTPDATVLSETVDYVGLPGREGQLGIMPQHELAALQNPSTAGVLKAVVGEWGFALMNIGLIISVAGALLAWTLLAAEIVFLAGKDGTMPKFFAHVNAKGAPTYALWVTNGLVQLFLIWTLFSSAGYLALLSLATSMILIPYLLCSLYAWMITVKGEAYATGGSKGRDLLIAVVSTIYGIWLIYAAGPKYLFLSMVLYAPGLIFYIWARREQKQKPFNSAEGIIAIIVVVLGLYALYELVSGRLSL